jgi:hypothetical protein
MPRMLRKAAALLATLTATAGVTGIVSASPAYADGTICPNAFCVYDNPNYRGLLVRYPARDLSPGDDHLFVARNRAESAVNHTGYWLCGVTDGVIDETIVKIKKGAHVPTFGSENDRIDWFYVRADNVGCD